MAGGWSVVEDVNRKLLLLSVLSLATVSSLSLGFRVLASPASPSLRVLVAAHSMVAGTELTTGDLRASSMEIAPDRWADYFDPRMAALLAHQILRRSVLAGEALTRSIVGPRPAGASPPTTLSVLDCH